MLRTETQSAETGAPLADVLAVLTNAARIPQWAPAFADQVSGDSRSGWLVTKDGQAFSLRVAAVPAAGTVDYLRGGGAGPRRRRLPAGHSTARRRQRDHDPAGTAGWRPTTRRHRLAELPALLCPCRCSWPYALRQLRSAPCRFPRRRPHPPGVQLARYYSASVVCLVRSAATAGRVDPPGAPLHRELPESHPQRVAHRQLILPVRSHDQHRELADPPGQEPQQVQGRLVGPVDVLDDHHASPRCALSAPSKAVNRSSRGPCTRHSRARSPPSWPARSRALLAGAA